MDDFLDKLAAAPLADPAKVFLPRGRRKGVRRTPAELEDFRAERSAKKERLMREGREHAEALFAYYATTSVPPERVAEHMGIELDAALGGLARHGRQVP